MRNEWNEVNRVKWDEMSELKDLTLWTLWESPSYESIESVPMKVTGMNPMRMSLSKWMESMRNEWIEWNEVKWVNGWKWLGTTLWEWSYGQLRVSLWKWLEWTLWECPYQNDQNRWEMNEMKWIEVNRGKMSEWMDLTWNNPMAKSLWSIESVPIKVTWVKMIWPNTIKMNGIDEKWMNWSE